MTSFAELGLIAPIMRVLADENYLTPTPIQVKAIPKLLAGHDMLGIAQTGTGKTAAFGLPLLQKLAETTQRALPRNCRALILAPTRELAIQIDQSLKVYGRGLKLSISAIYGGVSQHRQVQELAKGVDVLVATPGRLLDLISQRHLKLDHVSIFVIDEADRMFDMGFIRDVRKIVSCLPKTRQAMLFSATMPDEVLKLVGDLLHHPVRIEVAPQSKTADLVEQRVVFTEAKEKRTLLAHLLRGADFTRVIVFTRTKHGANRVQETLDKNGFTAEAIHGNKSQNARQRALARFKSGEAPILVATDIAARGIDVDDVSHVINFELPDEAESYVHRIGRTARAGARGVAISLVDASERSQLRQIERITKQQLQHMNVDLAAALPIVAPVARPQGERREAPRGAGHAPAGEQPRARKPHRKGQNRPHGAAPAAHAPAAAHDDRRAGHAAPKRQGGKPAGAHTGQRPPQRGPRNTQRRGEG